MATFRCYNNSDVIATLITTNFHLYLIHLWWQRFQMFLYGDVVYAQTWQVLTLKNCMEPFSYASTAYLVASALVSVRLFCKNLGNLEKFFGQMVYRPPWQKIARTPMHTPVHCMVMPPSTRRLEIWNLHLHKIQLKTKEEESSSRGK